MEAHGITFLAALRERFLLIFFEVQLQLAVGGLTVALVALDQWRGAVLRLSESCRRLKKGTERQLKARGLMEQTSGRMALEPLRLCLASKGFFGHPGCRRGCSGHARSAMRARRRRCRTAEAPRGQEACQEMARALLRQMDEEAKPAWHRRSESARKAVKRLKGTILRSRSRRSRRRMKMKRWRRSERPLGSVDRVI